MSVDDRTRAAYEAGAKEYATCFGEPGDLTQSQSRFLEALPDGGRILDYGCGPGQSAVKFLAAGYTVDAFDATPAMVDLAISAGVNARVATFDDIDSVAVYDGVWANFALLHAAREDLPRYIGAIARALNPGGAFHVGMKIGEGMARDRLERRYTYVTRDELAGLLTNAGITPIAEKEFEEMGFAGTVDPAIVMLGRKDA